MENIEHALTVFGAALLGACILLRTYGAAGALVGRLSFEAATSTSPRQQSAAKEKASPKVASGIDFSLWSEKRIRAFRESLAKRFTPPLALLNIPRIHLTVPVFNGTDEGVLNRGVGRIIGTARVGDKGNLGIAGHRDGFFRGLKDLEKGDTIELIAATRMFLYEIDNIVIIAPDDVRILGDRAVPTITLVTCYPFYFVGDAPQRYALQCSLKKSDPVTRGSQATAVSRPVPTHRKER